MDYASNMYSVKLLSPQQVTGSGQPVVGSAVDCKSVRDGVLLVNAGEMDAGTTVEVNLSTCDSATGTFTPVFASAKTIATTGKNTLYAYPLSQDVASALRRYVKLVYTVTNGKNALLSVSLTGWDRVQLPVT